jgi:hypothetical protein
MIVRFLIRQTQVLWTAVFIGSFAACTHVKNDSTPASSASPSAGAAISSETDLAASTVKPKSGAATAAKESVLDSQISGLRSQVAARREYNETLRNFVAAKEKQLAAIVASDRSAGPSAQEFDLRTSINSKLAEIDRESAAWQEKIDAHKTVLSKASDDSHSADLQAQIDQFSEQRAELLRQRAKLAALPDKLKK